MPTTDTALRAAIVAGAFACATTGAAQSVVPAAPVDGGPRAWGVAGVTGG